MQSKDQNGELGPCLKKTSVLTNSKHIAAILGKAKCRGQHQHVRLEGGRAAAAQIYPEVFCDAVCHGLKLEMQDSAWLDKVYEQLNITKTVEDLMATQVAEVSVPPDEESDLELYKSLYKELEFMDDVSGQPLDKARAVQARKAEMDYFKSMQVYSKVVRQPWMKVITTRWLDVNKGDTKNPDYRARLVAREIKTDLRPDLFAATPPLESLRTIISICASNQHARSPGERHVIMSNDIKRAYFYAPAVRPVYVAIPDEDWCPGDEVKVACLNLSLYGTRDAAQNWSNTYSQHLQSIGFSRGKASPCNFWHQGRSIALTVHGNDYTSIGSTVN
jgi:hypothetical protein